MGLLIDFDWWFLHEHRGKYSVREALIDLEIGRDTERTTREWATRWGWTKTRTFELLQKTKADKKRAGLRIQNNKLAQPGGQKRSPKTNGQTLKKHDGKIDIRPLVRMTQAEIDKLQQRFGEELDDKLDGMQLYLEATGKTYKSHYAALLNWQRMQAERDRKLRGKRKATTTDIAEACASIQEELWTSKK